MSKMSLAQRVEDLGENLHEVVLTVTVTASIDEKTAYLAEVAQAGIFLISGFNEQAAHAVMNTMCPNTLFPYARRSISELVSDGGFPPLTLQPVNFEQLYAQRMQELVNQQNGEEAAEERQWRNRCCSSLIPKTRLDLPAPRQPSSRHRG